MEVERRYDADLFLKGTETSPNNITGVTTNEAVNKSSKNIRLPQTVFPRFYDLQLQVHIHGNADTKDSYFNGSVTIEIQCLAATAELFIHAYPNLNVSRDQIKIFSDDKEDSKKTEIPIQTISYDKDAEWYHIQLKDALQPNASYKLIFGQFNSSLNYEPVGFYLSRYAENGTYKYLASTQFEPTYARRVFPCWDEPGFKAVFQVTIIRHKDFYTLSNMPVNNTVALHADWRQDQFQPSVKMSSYLLAFVICQFHGLRVVDSKGRNFTVWARPEKIESARYALDIGRRILTFFEDYFGVPYPLPKMGSTQYHINSPYLTATLKTKLNVKPNDWYIINIGQIGYYRVHYVDNNWEVLTDELLKNFKSVPASARPQIIGDLFHLANHGNVSFTTFLNLTKYLSQETQYVPWTTAGRALLYLDRMLLLDENYGGYQAYVRLLVNAAVRDVDWITMTEDRNEEKHFHLTF
uniref:Aminopeptidase N n=1 Tax=Trichobilharzia regenti TaxID=157069 RepID=A0AA85K2Y5_TRIRE|nr:unnamed protein product [Trichobilharzia regenti]